MTTDDLVEELFDRDTKKYFINKQKGGTSNQQGSRYEDYFSVMKLAELFQLVINDNDIQDIKLITQAEAFVDDLLIDFIEGSCKHHFQLKTSKGIKWGKGLKSISDDFHKQKKVNDKQEIDETRTFLVCSDETQATSLRNAIPITINDFTEVIFFPRAETANQLLLCHEKFKKSLEPICLSGDTDKLEALARSILGHWTDKKTTMSSVKELLSSLQKDSPNYLAQTSITSDLLSEVKQILSSITGFDYRIERGYFKWKYGSSDSGGFMYPIDSKEFTRFQQRIISKRPKLFDELEGIYL